MIYLSLYIWFILLGLNIYTSHTIGKGVTTEPIWPDGYHLCVNGSLKNYYLHFLQSAGDH